MRLDLVRAAAVVAMAAGAAAAQDVAFEKYELPNGMTVILHEDHSLPVVAVNTWYRVGSKEESAGRSGFAHLFEHLMFMGTQRVPGSQFDILMETGGGSNNASTSFDRTNYFSSGPASLLPTLLWLDADRLEDLGRTMTQEKLDKQRDVVRNERRQSIENQPYGKSELLMTEILFPAGHPYHNEVIGTHEDLEAATVQDVQDFFGTFYVPNNASLVVAGDFKSEEVKPLIAGLFGTIARGAAPMHVTAPPVVLGKVVRAVTLDQVQLPRVTICYHSASQYAPGDAELDLLAAVLSQGKSSRLYKRLVLDEKLASEVDATQSSAQVQSVFRIDVIAAEGASLDRIEAAVDEEVGKLLSSGVTSEELEQRKATIELSKVAQLQSVLAKADKLNEYQFFWGEPDGFRRDLDRYRSATPAGVHEVAKRTLTQDSRLIMRVLPTEPERPASARDARPSDGAAGSFSPPAPERFSVEAGGVAVPVMLWHKPELPIVAVQVQFTPGGALDAPAKAGRSVLTAAMIGEGAGDLSASAFADAVQGMGATFAARAGQESAGVSMTVVKRNFGKAMGLLKLALREPAMREEDWERVKRLHLDALKQSDDNPMVVAGRVGQRVLWGETSPYGWPSDGTRGTVSALTLGEVRAHRAELLGPASATVLIAGDVTRAEAEGALREVFAGWSGGRARVRSQPASPPTHEGLRVVIVDKPMAVQTVVRYVLPGIPAGDARRVKYRLINTILGGTFTSRLNANLREDKGYTYGAGSAFQMGPSSGTFVARASVKADVTGASLREFDKEFTRLLGWDVTGEELAKARETLRTDAIESFQGVNGVVGAAAGLVDAGLPFETIAKDMSELGAADVASLGAVVRDALPLSRGVLVLMGDKGLILEQIKDLGLPAPVEYTAEGVPVK